jgi:hypothetical protein
VCCWILGLQFPNTKVWLDLIRKLTSSPRYKKAQNQLIHPQTQCTTNIYRTHHFCFARDSIRPSVPFLFWSGYPNAESNDGTEWVQLSSSWMTDKMNHSLYGNPGWSKVYKSNWLAQFLSFRSHSSFLSIVSTDLYMAYHKCYRRGNTKH